jgi:hypothetical protein
MKCPWCKRNLRFYGAEEKNIIYGVNFATDAYYYCKCGYRRYILPKKKAGE